MCLFSLDPHAEWNHKFSLQRLSAIPFDHYDSYMSSLGDKILILSEKKVGLPHSKTCKHACTDSYHSVPVCISCQTFISI